LGKAVLIVVLAAIVSSVTTLATIFAGPYLFPITADQIADNAVIATKLANGSVTSEKILDGTLTAADLADSAIITTKLANGSVTSAKILDGTLTAVDLKDGAIITLKIADGAVNSEKISDGTITATDLADRTIVEEKIADAAVTTAKIRDSAIVTVKLADRSVTSAKILDGTIVAEDLATGAIIAAKIANGAVTTEKIADGAVTKAKLADRSVTDNKLAAQAVPVFAASSLSEISTTSTSWVDMTGTSVTLTLNRTSHLLILFSAEAMNTNSSERIEVEALVGTSTASPGSVYLTPTVVQSGTHTHALEYGSYSYNFYRLSVPAGTYTVKMKWRVSDDKGYIATRSLIVIAFPA